MASQPWPMARRATAATTDGDRLFVFGGCLDGSGDDAVTTNDLWAYDPTERTWNCLSEPRPDVGYDSNTVPGTRRYPSLDYHEGSLYAWAGCGERDEFFLLNDLWRFDFDGERWERIEESVTTYDPAGPIPPVRYTHETTVWNDSIYAFSGWFRNHETGTQRCLNDCWRYDLGANAWTRIHGLEETAGYDGTSGVPGTRYGAASARLDGGLYVFGGWSEEGDHADLWQFDLEGESWTCADGGNGDDPSPEPRYCSSLWAANESLYLATGRPHSDTDVRYADLWEFDPDSGRWTELQSAGFEHGGPGYFGKNAHAAVGTELLAFGGERISTETDPQRAHSDSVWHFDVETGAWSLARPPEP